MIGCNLIKLSLILLLLTDEEAVGVDVASRRGAISILLVVTRVATNQIPTKKKKRKKKRKKRKKKRKRRKKRKKDAIDVVCHTERTGSTFLFDLICFLPSGIVFVYVGK